MAKKKEKKPAKKVEEKKTIEKKTIEKKTIEKKTIEKKKLTVKKQLTEKKTISKKEPEEDEFEEISDKELENFEIEGLDMEKLTANVRNIVTKSGDEGIFQSDLWKKMKLTSRDGSRLALKLERQNMIKREKVLENGRWTYKLKIAHAPVSTESIEAAPCLICPVESKCTLEGEISPRTCPLIEQWVVTEFTNIKKPKK
ncbi:MAG TPA: transcriptional regulator [Nitrosopumilaceae archaeon]|nr:transcriptional regulator [Nitrosopumilaceae archaeon]